ncbi:Aureobasidin resistance protein Aur1 [Lunasporangiospora selenospora]|uniref:Aureobasidin resistance protein Aur1 n=1 Tax=Lunasporangiospora selenospora TaxID=979761 RepID=A0A9P6FW42_9FUNG|nr:Aureobasidin resistance protein Aur1 [Lunasporangiospora selenospora]
MRDATGVNIQQKCRSAAKATRAAVASTIRPLRQHRYSLFDLQYLFLIILFAFCYIIMDKPTWFKLPIALAAIALLVPRGTRQFMLPFSAIAGWLVLFYCCRFIPAEWRPHIFTSVLPTLENILYGGNISELLADAPSPAKDLLAWMPYGVLHFVLPFVTAALIFFLAPPGTLPVFSRVFGYMNLAGVLTQLLFPCAPPWYEAHYGSMEPATYTMPGDPGGLARVDDILGTNMYKSTFTASPMVFGAFPSLHSACAWQLAFFWVFIFGPRAIPVAIGYVFWIWWATMYLGHHYVVDLVGGAGYAVVAFWIGSFFLPSVLPDHHNEKAAHIIHDLGDAMSHTEKLTLFQANDDFGDFVGFKESKTWDIEEEEEDETEADMSSVVVVSVESEMVEQKTFSQSAPSSPTDSIASKKTLNVRQSWNGWQGYESWMAVLATVNSPHSSPTTSPSATPRNSSQHPSGFYGRHSGGRSSSRDSFGSSRSGTSVTTLNLDLEANVAMVQGVSYVSPLSSPSKSDSFPPLAAIEEDIVAEASARVPSKSRTRPSRLVLDQTVTLASASVPSTPMAGSFGGESSRSASATSPRPTSPRSFVSLPSPSLGRRFKDD